jgi:hypothetical protein
LETIKLAQGGIQVRDVKTALEDSIRHWAKET